GNLECDYHTKVWSSGVNNYFACRQPDVLC
ncbi:MAG: hypothetical protein ACI9FD_004744, partial [Gammaproteobacteria bacterium]